MSGKTGSAILHACMTLLLMGLLTLPFNSRRVQASPETLLYIAPSSIIDSTLTTGSSFTVDVKVSDVKHLYCWQINTIFDPAVLRVVDVIEGDFLEEQPKGTTGVVSRIENAIGWALFGCSTLGAYIGKSGTGTLVTVEFQILAVGESSIRIAETDPIKGIIETFLVRYDTHVYMQDIPFSTENGYFNNFAPTSVYELIETIENWHLPRGTEMSLITKLKIVGHLLDTGKADEAIRRVSAFIDRIQSLRGKTLTDEQADYSVSEAQRIIDAIKG